MLLNLVGVTSIILIRFFRTNDSYMRDFVEKHLRKKERKEERKKGRKEGRKKERKKAL